MIPDTHIRTYYLGGVWIHEHIEYVHIVWKEDNASSVFAPPKLADGNIDPVFISAMYEMGYSDPMRYAVEHEIAHQIVNEYQGKRSLVVWNDAHGIAINSLDPEIAQEEHLANKLQRFTNLGIEDEYGVLRSIFGESLEEMAQDFLGVAKPWLGF